MNFLIYISKPKTSIILIRGVIIQLIYHVEVYVETNRSPLIIIYISLLINYHSFHPHGKKEVGEKQGLVVSCLWMI